MYIYIICIYIYTCICTYIYIYMYIYIYILKICIHPYVYIYMFMYIKCSQLLYVYHSISIDQISLFMKTYSWLLSGLLELSLGILTACHFDVRVTPSTAGTGSSVERWSLMARLGLGTEQTSGGKKAR